MLSCAWKCFCVFKLACFYCDISWCGDASKFLLFFIYLFIFFFNRSISKQIAIYYCCGCTNISTSLLLKFDPTGRPGSSLEGVPRPLWRRGVRYDISWRELNEQVVSWTPKRFVPVVLVAKHRTFVDFSVHLSFAAAVAVVVVTSSARLSKL